MERYFVNKEVTLKMTIELDADSYEEAEEMIEDAWSTDEIFVDNYLKHAALYDSKTCAGNAADYGMTFDELCE